MALFGVRPLQEANMLQTRWLGRVWYKDAQALQRALFASKAEQYLLLLEHPSVYTLGVRTDLKNILIDPASVGAEMIRTDRGGDVTFHGPGQLVGYPILNIRDEVDRTPKYVHRLEQVIIDVLGELGLDNAGRLEGYPGVWVDPKGANPRKICAIGVKITRNRSMHGFALNVNTDLSMFGHIIPCGIADKPVTSLEKEGSSVSMEDVVEKFAQLSSEAFDDGTYLHQSVGFKRYERSGGSLPRAEKAAFPGENRVTEHKSNLSKRMDRSGIDAGDFLTISSRKPEWLRAKANMGPEYRDVKRTMRKFSLVTVCEEAGCPNIFECWADGTATFMINGENCTRACSFCLVETNHPAPLDPMEPTRVANAVKEMNLSYAVVTAVARDDLPDGGAGAFAATINEIRRIAPETQVEVLISDCKGDSTSLAKVFDARPDVLNHNLETVARLQYVVRPSASYARSLSVLARAKDAGLVTKSSLIAGMGETKEELAAALRDLASVGTDIVTIGQYLRPTVNHFPVARWITPEEFCELVKIGEGFGIGHVEASPMVRSSYHAKSSFSMIANSGHLIQV
ncbi:MAG: lipoyl synthase [Actinomycetota bacterium]|nr:MAG: lipoyl synthase [Actinomycetota bacterium]